MMIHYNRRIHFCNFRQTAFTSLYIPLTNSSSQTIHTCLLLKLKADMCLFYLYSLIFCLCIVGESFPFAGIKYLRLTQILYIKLEDESKTKPNNDLVLQNMCKHDSFNIF